MNATPPPTVAPRATAPELRHGPALALAAALVAVALNFIRLDQPNLWIDEIYTARWTQMSIAELLRSLATDLHPPLYFLIERWIVSFLGLGEPGLRCFSALAGAASVLATCWAFRPALGSRAALAAAWVLALMPDFGLYARMARYYAPATLLTLLAHGLFVRAALAEPPARTRLTWTLYAAIVIAIAYTSYAAMCVPLAHGAVLAVRRDRAALKRWALAMAVVAVAFAPCLSVFAHQLHTASSLPPSAVPGAWRVLLMPAYELFALTASELLLPWTPAGAFGALAGLTALVIGARVAHARNVRWAVTGTALAACGIGVVLLAALTRATPFVAAPARLLFLWPFAATLIGLALSQLALSRAARGLRIAIATALTLAWGVAWLNLYDARSFLNPIYLTPGREAARDLMTALHPGDLLLAEDDTGVPWYLTRMGFRGSIVDPIDSAATARALAALPRSVTGSAARVVWVRLARDGSSRVRPAGATRALLSAWGPLGSSRGYVEIDPLLRSVKARLLGTAVERHRLYVEWHDTGP